MRARQAFRLHKFFKADRTFKLLFQHARQMVLISYPAHVMADVLSYMYALSSFFLCAVCAVPQAPFFYSVIQSASFANVCKQSHFACCFRWNAVAKLTTLTLSFVAEEQKIELFMVKQINYALRQYLSSPLQIYGEKDKIHLEEPQCFPLDRKLLSQDLNEIRKNVKVKGLAA